MLNLNVIGETKYLVYMQIYTACHQKYQNKSFLMRLSASHGLLQVVRVRVIELLCHVSLLCPHVAC